MRISKRLCKYITASLIGIVIASCIGLGYLSACVLSQTAVNGDYVIFTIITVFIAFISSVAVALIGFSIKTEPKNPVEEIHALLKRFKEGGGIPSSSGNEADEIALVFEGVMNDLHGSLRSIRVKVHAIDHSVEVLTKVMNQVAADQANLFSLSAAIESAYPQYDGFSVVFAELLSLIELTGRLTNDIHALATQLQAGVAEVGTELEHVLRRVDPSRISAPTDAGACGNATQGEQVASAVE